MPGSVALDRVSQRKLILGEQLDYSKCDSGHHREDYHIGKCDPARTGETGALPWSQARLGVHG